MVLLRCIIFREDNFLEEFSVGLVVISVSGVCLFVVYCKSNESIVIIVLVRKFSFILLRWDFVWIFIDKVVILDVSFFFEGLFGIEIG